MPSQAQASTMLLIFNSGVSLIPKTCLLPKSGKYNIILLILHFVLLFFPPLLCFLRRNVLFTRLAAKLSHLSVQCSPPQRQDKSSPGCPVQRQSCGITAHLASLSVRLLQHWTLTWADCCFPLQTCWGCPGQSRSYCLLQWPGTSSAPGTLGLTLTVRSEEKDNSNLDKSYVLLWFYVTLYLHILPCLLLQTWQQYNTLHQPWPFPWPGRQHLKKDTMVN